MELVARRGGQRVRGHRAHQDADRALDVAPVASDAPASEMQPPALGIGGRHRRELLDGLAERARHRDQLALVGEPPAHDVGQRHGREVEVAEHPAAELQVVRAQAGVALRARAMAVVGAVQPIVGHRPVDVGQLRDGGDVGRDPPVLHRCRLGESGGRARGPPARTISVPPGTKLRSSSAPSDVARVRGDVEGAVVGRVPKLVVGVDDAHVAVDEADLGPSVEDRGPRADGIGRQRVVGVHEGDVIACRLRDAAIGGCDLAGVGLVDVAHGVAIARHDLARAVRRAVVDDDDLELLARMVLGEHAVEAAADEVAVLVGRDDARHARGAHAPVNRRTAAELERTPAQVGLARADDRGDDRVVKEPRDRQPPAAARRRRSDAHERAPLGLRRSPAGLGARGRSARPRLRRRGLRLPRRGRRGLRGHLRNARGRGLQAQPALPGRHRRGDRVRLPPRRHQVRLLLPDGQGRRALSLPLLRGPPRRPPRREHHRDPRPAARGVPLPRAHLAEGPRPRRRADRALRRLAHPRPDWDYMAGPSIVDRVPWDDSSFRLGC